MCVLGLLVEACGGVVGKINVMIAQAARIFGSFQCSVFTDLTMETKQMVYRFVVLGVLLYGAETWAPTQEMVSKLN